MLKIKDSVDLKELEKFGFKYEYEYVTEEQKSEFYYKNGLYIFLGNRKLDDDAYGIRELETIYDLIKDGLVEKVEE
jgi:hypothetical protein